MTKSTITIEQIHALIAEHSYDSALVDALEHLLAAMDSEPVENHIGSKNALDAIVSFIKSKSNPTVKCYEGVSEQLFKDNCHGIHSHVIEYILKLGEELEDLRAEQDEVQPASERDQVRSAHAEWSQATFGNVGPVGPLKHLSKEALEAAAEPGDLSEWADMQFLLWDAQRRAGITDEQITKAMIDKLAVNKQREWPEPKDGEPRLHIKEQPAPVVPDEKPMPNSLSMYAVDAVAAIAEVRGWNACRAAMFAAAPQSPGSEPATVPIIPARLVDSVTEVLRMLDEYPERLVPVNRQSALIRELRSAVLEAASI